jgi:hypothetical protein
VSENNESRISFTKNLIVSRSGRGYVTAHVRGTKITVEKWMEEDLRCRIRSMTSEEYKATGDKQWREAMKLVEEQAIEEAKQLFRKSNG